MASQHFHQGLLGFALASFLLAACRPVPAASVPPPAEKAPDANTSGSPEHAPSRQPTDISAAQATGWLALFAQLDKIASDAPDPATEPPQDEEQARQWLCTAGDGTALCEGPAPWAVVWQDDATWVWFVVAPQGDAMIHSEAFGHGGLARCGASTTAVVGRDADSLWVTVDDYFEFPGYECDCPEGVDPDSDDPDTVAELCECYTACGDPVDARCTMQLDPRTLALSEPDEACSAFDKGEALGLSL